MRLANDLPPIVVATFRIPTFRPIVCRAGWALVTGVIMDLD